jgi:nicotinate-nucleotide--dimethylbenzimidazole phosphoribosyltransferase
LEQTCSAIVPVDGEAALQAQRLLDGKTKPRRSLGRLEELACRLAAAYRTALPPLAARAIVVMAADHGVAEEGVSAYPPEVTAQMVRNFAAGGAAINVLARQAGARLCLVDMGTKTPPESPQCPQAGVRPCRLGPGTDNFTRGPAMSRETAIAGLEVGIRLALELAEEGVGLVGLGDMGIANTTASSALTAALTGADPEEVTGRGTGVDDGGLRRKTAAIRRALQANRLSPAPAGCDPLDVLARLGGFEIAGLAGVVLGGAARRVAVVLDGFITGAAALVAARLCPAVGGYLIASHRSVEPGHARVLQDLGLRPLLDLDMRLGEGTGAALALHLVEASLRVLREMATFASAGVTDIRE